MVLADFLVTDDTVAIIANNLSKLTFASAAEFAVLDKAVINSSELVAAAISIADILSTTCIDSSAVILYPFNVEVNKDVASDDSIAPTFDNVIEDFNS